MQHLGMNALKNILGPLGSVAAAIGVISTAAGSAMSVARSNCADDFPLVVSHGSILFYVSTLAYNSYHSCRYDVDGGQRAVLFQKFSLSGNSAGVQEGVVGEGTHFLIPWFQQAIM
jgi:hypothetical protein